MFKNPMVARLVVLALVLCLLPVATGCFGGFSAWHKVHEFNTNVSDNKWIQELVFLVCSWLPVYGIAGFVDMLIFNSIEFWTGNNPLGNEWHDYWGAGGMMEGAMLENSADGVTAK